jgi:hypothetical protein
MRSVFRVRGSVLYVMAVEFVANYEFSIFYLTRKTEYVICYAIPRNEF